MDTRYLFLGSASGAGCRVPPRSRPPLRPEPVEDASALETTALDTFIRPTTSVARGLEIDLHRLRGGESLRVPVVPGDSGRGPGDP